MTLTIAILIVSILWLVMGSVINKLESVWLTEPMIALLTGIFLGPFFKIIEFPENQHYAILEWTAMITMAMALMAAGLKFKHSYIVSHKKMLGVLVIGGMILMFICSSLITRFILGFEWPAALLIGAIITPTDPVVSSSMISGKFAKKFLNNNIRSSLYFESGINDGLALPLVAAGWMMMQLGQMDWLQWLQKVVLYESLLAVVIGSILGYLAGLVMHHALKAKLMTQKTLLTYSVGLAFLVLSLLELVKMNGIIGVFFASLLFNRSIKQEEDLEEERVQVAMERLVTIPAFFLSGVMIPWVEWTEMGIPLIFFVIGILLFRRLPALILLKPFLDKIGRWPRVLVIGWFGPIGIAALFYSIRSTNHSGFIEGFPVVMAVIVGSVLIHGLTGVPFSRLYRKHDTDNIEGDSEEDSVEEEEVV